MMEHLEQFPLELLELTNTELDAIAGGLAATTAAIASNVAASAAGSAVTITIPGLATVALGTGAISLGF
jgi:hypothetical protein